MATKKTNAGDLNVEWVNPDSLIPYINNARTHSEEQINQIAGSIKEFGFTNPILVDEEFGVLAGHGRLTAAKKLGRKTVPVIRLTNLTEAQKKAYILADNKIAENSGWDNELLKIELDSLKEVGFDLSLIGFEETDMPDFNLDSFFTEEEKRPEKKVEEPEVIKCPHCGEVFEYNG